MPFIERPSRESFSLQINPMENHKHLANSILNVYAYQKTQKRMIPSDPRKQMLLYQIKLRSCLATQEAQLYYKKLNKMIKKSLSLNDKTNT